MRATKRRSAREGLQRPSACTIDESSLANVAAGWVTDPDRVRRLCDKLTNQEIKTLVARLEDYRKHRREDPVESTYEVEVTAVVNIIDEPEDTEELRRVLWEETKRRVDVGIEEGEPLGELLLFSLIAPPKGGSR